MRDRKPGRMRPAPPAGVGAELYVYDSQSHAQCGFGPGALETREAFTEITRFFDRHLGH